MVIEIVPQIIERYMNEHKDKLTLDIETTLNGKVVNSENIVSAIQDTIVRQLNI